MRALNNQWIENGRMLKDALIFSKREAQGIIRAINDLSEETAYMEEVTK